MMCKSFLESLWDRCDQASPSVSPLKMLPSLISTEGLRTSSARTSPNVCESVLLLDAVQASVS